MDKMEYEGFKLEKIEDIGILTLNRPEKLNAITYKMITYGFPNIFNEIQDDPEIRVLIVTGAGKAFCVGGDVADLHSFTEYDPSLNTSQRLRPLASFALSLYNLEKPTIAAINGVAATSGLAIALLCDIRIASENARFGIGFVSRGLIPDCGATFSMPRCIGAAKSFELMYTGDLIDAKEAERIGLVNKIVPKDNVMLEAQALAKRLAKSPPLALAQAKRAIHNGLMNNLEQQLFFESYAQYFLFKTEDFKEGVSSFLEKREAKFKGK